MGLKKRELQISNDTASLKAVLIKFVSFDNNFIFKNREAKVWNYLYINVDF